MNVRIVGKALFPLIALQNTREFILGQSHTNVRSVEKSLFKKVVSVCICEPTRESDRLNVRNVENALQHLATLKYTLKFAQRSVKVLKERTKVRERQNVSYSLSISASITAIFLGSVPVHRTK